MNLIARLEYELAYYDSAVHRFNHYTMRTLPVVKGVESVKNIISEYSKLVQKELNTRYDRMGKVIHRELCKKLKFDHTTKWYIYKSESILENEMHQILWDFEIETALAKQPEVVTVKKKEKKKGKS